MFRVEKTKSVWISGAVLAVLLGGACSAPSPATIPDTPTPFTPALEESALPPTAAPQPADTAAPSPSLPDAAAFPDPTGYTWKEIASGLTRPVGLVSSGDGSGRLFIIEQPGQILIHDGDRVLETPFLDIRDRVSSTGSEQGLLGLAFHPDYQNNGLFFVNYTAGNGNTAVSRFQVSSDPDQGDRASEVILLTFTQPYQNHNGGQIRFGPQGYLWIASGDGGGSGDPQGNAQRTDNLLGKLLRIDINKEPYAIPEDNPFGSEIWAYGLRNPWRFTFDPRDEDLYIADVGQNEREEINYLPAGSPGGTNFGWNYREGSVAYQGAPPDGAGLVDPIHEYDHSQGCSVSGGAVYRGSLPEWQGIYLYSDFCSGQIWGLLGTPGGEWQNQLLFQVDGRIAAIDQDSEGELYLLDILGTIRKLTPQ